MAGELDFGLSMSDVLLPAVELLYLLNIDAGRALENLCRRQWCRCWERRRVLPGQRLGRLGLG